MKRMHVSGSFVKHLISVVCVVSIIIFPRAVSLQGRQNFEEWKSEGDKDVEEVTFIEMGRMKAEFQRGEEWSKDLRKYEELFKTKKPARPLRDVDDDGKKIPLSTKLSGMLINEMGAAPDDEAHEVVFQVKQKGKEYLHDFLMDVSAPRKKRPHYTRDEVAEITSNPEASEAVESFLQAQGENVISYDMGPYGEYIRATAKISVWSELLNADFRIFRVTYDEFENAMKESPRRLIRALSYSLPIYLASHVETVRNTVEILPRRSLIYHNPSEILIPPSNLKAKHDKKKNKKMKESKHHFLADDDCPDGQFKSLHTGKCKSDVVVPKTLNMAYGISSNSGGYRNASQGILSMIDDNVSPEDLEVFSNRFGITNNPIEHLEGGHAESSLCHLNQSLCAEPNLDVQYMRAMSWDSEMWRFFIDDPVMWLANLTALEYPPLVNSVSYGYLEPELAIIDPTYISTFDQEAIKLGMRGVTLVVASGDDGVGSFLVRSGTLFCGYIPSFPATSPYVTAVGGTQGIEKVGGAVYSRHLEEEAANCVPNISTPELYTEGQPGGRFNSTGAGIVSGGGFSMSTSAPDFQRQAINDYFYGLGLLNMPWIGYSLTGRGYPDISLASASYIVSIGGEFYPVSGTSASAPAFGGMVSLINSERMRRGKGPIGYLNPLIYEYSSNFTRDVVSGDNNCAAGDCSQCCGQGFKATSGWDPVTGFGTIDFPAFKEIAVSVDAARVDEPLQAESPGWIPMVFMCLVVITSGYVIYSHYLHPADDRYEPITENNSSDGNTNNDNNNYSRGNVSSNVGAIDENASLRSPLVPTGDSSSSV